MKKLLKTVLCVLSAVLLITACSDSGSASESGKVQATFAGYRLLGSKVAASRDVSTEVTLETKAASDLYWTYTATNGTETVSETALNVVDDVAQGLPTSSFGTFDYGDWTFTVNAYESYSDGTFSDPYYAGIATEVTFDDDNSSVYATVVRYYEDGTQGTLLIYLTAYQADGEEADAAAYTIGYTITSETDAASTTTGTDSENESLSDNGLSLSLDPDYYTVTITLSATIDDEDITIATAEASNVYILKGGTTSLTADITEGETASITLTVTVTYTDYDSDGNETTSSTQIYPETESEESEE